LVPSCITITFLSILVDPIARDRSLAMARRRHRLRQMNEWSKDHVAAIGFLNSKPWFSRWILVKLETGWDP
jgi:hypothetical protein